MARLTLGKTEFASHDRQKLHGHEGGFIAVEIVLSFIRFLLLVEVTAEGLRKSEAWNIVYFG